MKLSPAALALTLITIGFSSCKPQTPGQTAEAEDKGWDKQPSEIAILQTLNDKLTDAYQREDVALLRELLSDDHIHNNVFGSRMTKDEFLKDIESGVLKFKSYTTPEIEWYVTDDLAVATGVIEAQAVRGGRPVPATTFRFTRIFNLEEDQWKVLLFQNAMVPDRKEAP